MGWIATYMLHPQEQNSCSSIQAQESCLDLEESIAEILEILGG